MPRTAIFGKRAQGHANLCLTPRTIARGAAGANARRPGRAAPRPYLPAMVMPSTRNVGASVP